MSTLFIFIFIFIFTYIFYKIGQQETVDDYYEEAIIDIESMQAWANTRPTYPFGMKTQMELSDKLLHQAKNLRDGSEYEQAYHIALQSLHAIDKAQRIYVSASQVEKSN